MSMTQDFDAIDRRHLDISNDQIVKCAVNFVFRRLAGLHGLNPMPVAAQGDVEHFADGALVVANQNVSHEPSLPLPQPEPPSAMQPILAHRVLGSCPYWPIRLCRSHASPFVFPPR